MVRVQEKEERIVHPDKMKPGEIGVFVTGDYLIGSVVTKIIIEHTPYLIEVGTEKYWITEEFDEKSEVKILTRGSRLEIC